MHETRSLRMVPLGQPPRITFAGTLLGGVASYEEGCPTDHWGLDLFACAGRITFTNAGVIQEFTIGDAVITPPGSLVRIDFFSPRRTELIEFTCDQAAHRRQPIAPLISLGRIQQATTSKFRGVIASWQSSPACAQARLWNLLWDLHELTAASTPCPEQGLHPVVVHAQQLIAGRLQEKLLVSEIAAECGVSSSSLIRLFKRHLGSTVQRYVRQLRAKIAGDLLRHSTVPVKDVAWRVGYDDLQAFSKMVRMEHGHSPRKLRQLE